MFRNTSSRVNVFFASLRSRDAEVPRSCKTVPQQKERCLINSRRGAPETVNVMVSGSTAV